MFGFGDKEKDKLEENMEDIKQLINKGRDERKQKQATDTDNTETPPQQNSQSFEDQPEDLEVPQEFQNQGQETQSFEEQAGGQPAEDTNTQDSSPSHQESFDKEFGGQNPDRSQEQTGGRKKFSEQEQQVRGHEESVKQEKAPVQETETQEEAPRQAPSDTGRSRETTPKQDTTRKPEKDSLNERIPEPAETKKIDVPEIEKGPLFIRRKKFERAQEMIQEMRYLSQEIEGVVNRLENGIKQDQKTEREAKELLHSLEDDRSDVKDIISPKEEA